MSLPEGPKPDPTLNLRPLILLVVGYVVMMVAVLGTTLNALVS